MLRELAIKNFAIIDDIKISFSKGLSILTGETGAGKSIIIEAVNLLLGGRASSDLVRSGESHAELEVFFMIAPESRAAKIMRNSNFDPSEGLQIKRVIALNGKHKIFINARQSTIQTLKLVTENLASISSQHAHQSLLNEDNHLDTLDSFAGTFKERREIQTIYNELLPLTKELSNLKANIDRITEENEFLRFQIDEIENANIQPNEDETLEIERNRLKNGSQIFETIQSGINEIYSKDGSILERLGAIKSEFDKFCQIDNSLNRGTQTLNRTIIELEDLTDELRRLSDRVDLDPDSLEKTQARLDLIQKLKRKYCGASGTLNNLFNHLESMKSKISATNNIQDKITEMEKRANVISEQIGQKALKLSKKRAEAANRLSNLAECELKELEMESAKFKIAVSQTKAENRAVSPQSELFPDDNLSHLLTVNGMKIYPTGIDKASFLIAPNPGEPPKPLNKIASGGELSRVVLALKATLSENEPQGTLIFDEVDSGIGGRTSDKVGIKLKSLSKKYQVICITHLAQIAKYGDNHYKIAKQVKNNRTSTVITQLLEHQERINEIARMMGGTNISQATIDHAAEMLNSTISSSSDIA
ncbi:MAG: DNA repair protein RecN [Desulfamplus sp.]|nr:DNA repair protein RecN [Desulfamplus sp.]